MTVALLNFGNSVSRVHQVSAPSGVNPSRAARRLNRVSSNWLSGVDPVEHPREGDRLAQVLDAADPGDDPLDAHAEARMGHAAVRAKITVPAERLLGQVVLADALVELLAVGEALAAPHDLS